MNKEEGGEEAEEEEGEEENKGKRKTIKNKQRFTTTIR